MKKTFNIYFLLAELTGLAIAWIDTQPNWDDTGITVLLVSLIALLFGFLTLKNPWIIAVAVSM